MSKFGSAIQIAQIATPVSPPAGAQLIYPKSDGRWYTKDSSGTEVGYVDTSTTQTVAGAKTFSANTAFSLGIKVGTSAVSPADGQLRLGSNAPSVYFDRSGTQEWLLYDSGGSLYVRDVVNARMQLTFDPGTSDSTAATTLNSTLSIGGALTAQSGIYVYGGWNPAWRWISGRNVIGTTGNATDGLDLQTGDSTVNWTAEKNNFTLTAQATSLGSNVTTMRSTLFNAPNYSGAYTITNAATVAIAGAPGTVNSAAITNPYAFWVQAGTSRFDGNVNITGTTYVDTLNTSNTISSDGDLYVQAAYFNGDVDVTGELTLSGNTYPNFDDYLTLGTAVKRWSTVYATTFNGSGASLTNLNASNLSTGTVGTARLGSGTADNTTFLRGDGTWATPAGGGSYVDLSTNQTIAGLKSFSDSANFDSDLSVNGVLYASGGAAGMNPSTSLETLGTVASPWYDVHTQTLHVYDLVSSDLIPDGSGAMLGLSTSTWGSLFVDNLTTGLVLSNLQPDVDVTYSLGSAISRWNDVWAANFHGSGASLTLLNASNISTGTVGIGRLPTGTTSTTVALGNHTHTGVYEAAFAAGTTSQYRRGDKTWQTLDKTAVGLSNVANVDQTNASNLTSGTVGTARLGTGTADATTFLRGDGTWASNLTQQATYASAAQTSASATHVVPLTITLPAAGTYRIRANGTIQTTATSTTAAMVIGGTATASAASINWLVNTALSGTTAYTASVQTALGTSVTSQTPAATATALPWSAEGAITVTAAGTLTFEFWRSAGSGTLQANALSSMHVVKVA